MASIAEGEDTGSQGHAGPRANGEEAHDRAKGGERAFNIVLWMLLSLSVVVVLALLAPLLLDVWIWSDAKVVGEELRQKRLDAYFEYYKWCLSMLMGTFGAWIGAGAAYFFGRENLKESSASTERALKIQQGGGRPAERIRDLTLTAMNTEFLFGPGDDVGEVCKGLNAHRGYWFVPVLDDSQKGTIGDVVHARLVWEWAETEDRNQVKGEPADGKAIKSETIKALLDRVDASNDPKAKKLHGSSFFLQVSPDDRTKEVQARMSDMDLAVGIVVDGKGRPTHCFTQMELNTFLNAKT
jgi:hypothetical protein